MSSLGEAEFHQKTAIFLDWFKQLKGAYLSPKIQVTDLRDRNAGRGIGMWRTPLSPNHLRSSETLSRHRRHRRERIIILNRPLRPLDGLYLRSTKMHPPRAGRPGPMDVSRSDNDLRGRPRSSIKVVAISEHSAD